jgi:hypothetical protein
MLELLRSVHLCYYNCSTDGATGHETSRLSKCGTLRLPRRHSLLSAHLLSSVLPSCATE